MVKYQHQIFDKLEFFYCVAYNKTWAFCTIYPVWSYWLLESTVIDCVLPISYLMSGVVMMVCEKNLKINQPLDQFYYFTRLILIAFSSEKIVIFLFLSAVSERQESTISDSLQAQYICKPSSKIFPPESFIDKAIQFNRSFMQW